MTTFKLEIAVGDAPFVNDRSYQIGRCLQQVTAMLQMDDRSEGPVRDGNGNQVGVFWFEED